MPDRDAARVDRSWSLIAWTISIGLLVISSVLGFGVLSRYQQNDPTLDLWSAICRGIGIPAGGGGSSNFEQPSPVVSTHLVWSTQTLARLRGGDVKRGEFVARNCVACHRSTQANVAQLIPKLDGMNAAAIYKQLQDYRVGDRTWGVMGALAKALTESDAVDVATYFASKASAPAYAFDSITERGFDQPDEAQRLAFVGDPKRGIASCSACHGPSAYKLGAPSLEGQDTNYIERQLTSFAQGVRRNDTFGTMRAIARQLTAEEKKALAQFYGSRAPLVARSN